MALNWLGGSKVDHPMADPKRARQIVDELPANDAAKALAEITEWLESLNGTDGFKLDRRYENVDLLDAAAKNHQRKLAQDYLAMPRQQKYQENRLWTTSFGFWRQLGDAYIRCVREHEAGMSGAAAIRKNLPVIVARAVRALALQLKWILLRYGAVEPRLWTDIALLYRLAEQKGWDNGTVPIYPGAHGAGSVKQEFLRALMFSASSPDGLPPLKQEIAERAVAHFSGSFSLASRPDGCTHGFDLSAPKAPARLLKDFAPSETMRYFGAGGASGGLARLTAQIAERGDIPPDVILGGNYEKDVVTGVLNHLALQWSEQPPARSSERRHTAGRLTVVPGMTEIMGVLDPAVSGDLDFSQEQTAPSAESWIVVNVSEGGYGAIIPAQKSDWIKVGTLVGLQNEISSHWGIGLIRRISRDEQQQRRVGIQLLTRTAIPIKVARSGAAVSADHEPQSAVLLATSPDKQGEVGVVMRTGIFNGRDSLDMTVKDKAYLLMPSRRVEDGEDFEWAKFKVMQRGA
ncbi:MAG TPA: hypothetical protein VMN03_14550 [Burkholderiales bacterium]|nr:hypothetical protein [Burkholderiales bacterium]